MGLQVSRIVKVDWDTTGEETEWVRLFDADDLPELVTIHEYVEDDDVAEWLAARYGFCVNGWVDWSAIKEATTMAENVYSADPI